MKYAVVEIAGKQYLAQPGKSFLVNNVGNGPEVEGKVLLLSDDKLEIGKPYLKDPLKFEVVGSQKKKIRVATYHAKANYRRVRGSKNIYSIVKLSSGRSNAVKKP